MRMTESQILPRLLAFFHTSNGFFWSNVLVVWSTLCTMYSYILLAIMVGDNGSRQSSLRNGLLYSVGWVQLGMVLSLPLLMELVR
eukprot:SAG31_NODE_6684_length_1925_cov_1.533406_1_plen_85_part_00